MSMGMFHSEPSIRPIDFTILEDSESSSDDMPFVEITTAEPFRIQNASQQWLDIFQFSKEEIAGRTLRVVCGPTTRIPDLKQVIGTAANGKESSAPICFYTSAGTGKLMAVKAQPNNSWDSCTLTMVPSNAVSMKDAMVMEDCSAAIVSAEKPHIIQHVNTSFSYEFGMSQDIWAGKALRMLHGPRTNAMSFGTMLKDATDGLSRTQELIVYTSDCQESWCEVSVTPVLSGASVAHLMVSFRPINLANSEQMATAKLESMNFAPAPQPIDTNNFVPAPMQMPEHDIPAHLHFEPPFFEMTSSSESDCSFHFPAATDVQSSGFAAATPQVSVSTAEMLEHYDPETNSIVNTEPTARTSLKLIPRKKRPVGGEYVELTTARLQELSTKSMKAAAEELGIAASTLKKACRKLGVERWPSGTQAKNKALDYDGSYVRRLFAKYGGKRSGDGQVCSPPSDQEDWAPTMVSHHDGLAMHSHQQPAAAVAHTQCWWGPAQHQAQMGDAEMMVTEQLQHPQFMHMDTGLGVMQW